MDGMCKVDEIRNNKKKQIMEPELKTSSEWYIEYPIQILDPDGWDRKNFQYSWYEELITFQEFDRRAMASTCISKKP